MAVATLPASLRSKVYKEIIPLGECGASQVISTEAGVFETATGAGMSAGSETKVNVRGNDCHVSERHH